MKDPGWLPAASASSVAASLLAALAILSLPAAGAAEGMIEGYSNFATFRSQVRQIARSEYVNQTSLGRTLGGRDVLLLTIGTGKPDEKPAILVVGGAEPVQLVDSEVALRMARQLAEDAAGDGRVRKLLDRVTFYVIARASPDAAEAFFEMPYGERSVNQRPIDNDNDGRIDEDGPEDLNGDGLITMMRVEDPAGEHIAHPDDARILIKADPKKGERGRYRLYTEGRDNDGDGKINEDPPGGVGFNRNFPHNYPYFQQGAGPHQVSEVETRAVADFAFDHPNIVLVWTLSDQDNLLERWKPDAAAEKKRIKTTLLSADAPYFNQLADAYGKLRDKENLPKSPDSAGSLSDWAYFQYGRWSIATRSWWIPKATGSAERPKPAPAEPDGDKHADESAAKNEKPAEDQRGAEERNALAWFEEQDIDGFVEWQSFDHPDFPDRKPEIGGFKPFLRQNPPADQLDPLAEKHLEFLLQVAAMLPGLSIAEVKVEPLGSGVWRVTAAVENRGKLPTESEMGRITRDPQRLQLELKLPDGAELVTGHARRRIGVLAGGGGRVEETWLVHAEAAGSPEIEVRAWSPMAGSVAKRVALGETAP